jgi:hypothetical protein
MKQGVTAFMRAERREKWLDFNLPAAGLARRYLGLIFHRRSQVQFRHNRRIVPVGLHPVPRLHRDK